VRLGHPSEDSELRGYYYFNGAANTQTKLRFAWKNGLYEDTEEGEARRVAEEYQTVGGKPKVNAAFVRIISANCYGSNILPHKHIVCKTRNLEDKKGAREKYVEDKSKEGKAEKNVEGPPKLTIPKSYQRPSDTVERHRLV